LASELVDGRLRGMGIGLVGSTGMNSIYTELILSMGVAFACYSLQINSVSYACSNDGK